MINNNPFTAQDARPKYAQYVYVVGKITTYPAFEIQGIFTESYDASELCLNHNTDDDMSWFVMPIILNKTQPIEIEICTEAYYPKAITLARLL